MPICYDQAVAFYDATRGYRDGVAERYRDAFLDVTGADLSSRILELGIGTGLIAQAFIAAGHNYAGVDLSRAMMREVARKLNDARPPLLVQADIRHLPFAAASYDIVQAVRVFHHLDDWRGCIDEARRLLKPGGALLIAENIAPAESDTPPWALVQIKWDEILRGLGVGDRGLQRDIRLADEVMVDYMRASGARASTGQSVGIPREAGILPHDGGAPGQATVQQRLGARRKRPIARRYARCAAGWNGNARRLMKWRSGKMIFRAVIGRW